MFLTGLSTRFIHDNFMGALCPLHTMHLTLVRSEVLYILHVYTSLRTCQIKRLYLDDIYECSLYEVLQGLRSHGMVDRENKYWHLTDKGKQFVYKLFGEVQHKHLEYFTWTDSRKYFLERLYASPTPLKFSDFPLYRNEAKYALNRLTRQGLAIRVARGEYLISEAGKKLILCYAQINVEH